MSKPYAIPLSPRCLSSIAPPPPWHYAGDCLIVEFWAYPAAAAATLPAGLTADPKSPGHAAALFVDWQFTGENDELLDPARYQYASSSSWSMPSMRASRSHTARTSSSTTIRR